MRRKAKPTKTVSVDVTHDDIAKGLKSRPGRCPISIAVARAIGAQCNVYWDNMHVLGSSKAVVSLPPAAKFFIQDFDSGEDVQPFIFEISI